MLAGNKIIIAILCLLATVQAPAQENYLQVKAYTKAGDFAFPVFFFKTDTAITGKMNVTLQLGELSLLKGHEQNNLFEEAEKSTGFYGSKVGLGYTVYSNNARLLSLVLDEAASGMTMHYWQNYYCFNTGNGDRVSLADIFTPAGLKIFAAMVARERRLAFVQDSTAGDVAADAYSNNEPCFTELNNEWFGISHDSLFVDGTNCLPKSYLADAPTLRQWFSFRQIKQLLSAYGLALFTPGADVSTYRSFHFPQIMRGMINGKYPVYFLLRSDGGTDVVGIYAYLDTGVGIGLRGTLENGRLQLTEQENGSGAVIDARVSGEQVTGTWTGKKHNRTFSFHVKKW